MTLDIAPVSARLPKQKKSTAISKSTLAIINAVMLVGAAHAQSTTNAPATTASSTNAPAKLPDVVVTGQQENPYKPETLSSPKYTVPLRDIPQTISVVPKAVMEEQGATTLRDVLKNVPGISIQAGEGGVPAGDNLSIRGFNARTDLFVDGVRDIGGYTRDPFNIEQVEISKGPNSTYAGRGSTGGAVNMVSKSPKLNSAYDANLGYGTDQYYRGTVDLNQPIPQLDKLGVEGAAFRINGLYHDQDFANRDYIHDQRWAVAPSLALGLGTDTRVIFSYVHLQENNLAGYGLPFVSSSTNAFGGASALGQIAPLPYNSFLGLVNRDYEDVVNDVGSIRLEHDFSEDIKIQNQTRFGQTKRDSVITAPRIITNPSFNPDYNLVPGTGTNLFGLNRELQSRDQTDQVFSTATDLTTKFDTAKLEHTVVTTLEYSHETEVNYLRSAGITPWRNGTTTTYYPAPLDNPFNPNPYSTYAPYRRTGARNEAISDAIGLSAFDTVKISEQWLFNLGLRADSFNVDYNQYATNGTVTRLSHYDLEPTWRAGLVYKPLPNGSIYLGYGTSFNPSAEGMTLATNTTNLDPEIGSSYEIGTKWDFFKERLSLSTALFRTDKDNYRTADPIITGALANNGKVRVQGIEFGAAGKLTDDWTIYGGYVIMDSEILESNTSTPYNGVTYREEGHKLSNTPEQTASLWTTYELPFHLSIGTGVQFVDKRFSNNLETSSVDGYWLQDALIGWKANKNLDIRLNASNIWDKEYIDRVGGGHAIPGTGRTFIVSAAFKF